MRAPGNLDDPEAVAAHAARQAEAQAQVAMSDLGTAAIRSEQRHLHGADRLSRPCRSRQSHPGRSYRGPGPAPPCPAAGFH